MAEFRRGSSFSGKFLVPDVAVQKLSVLQAPHPSKPIYLCVEILSPEDRFGDTVAKCDEYHAWGVSYCWIIDPEGKQCQEIPCAKPASTDS